MKKGILFFAFLLISGHWIFSQEIRIESIDNKEKGQE